MGSIWPQGTVFWFRRVAADGSVFGCVSQQEGTFGAALLEEFEERLGFDDALEIRVFRSLDEMSKHEVHLLDEAGRTEGPTEVCPCCQSTIPRELGVTYRSVGSSYQAWSSQQGKRTFTYTKEVIPHYGRDFGGANTEAPARGGGVSRASSGERER